MNHGKSGLPTAVEPRQGRPRKKLANPNSDFNQELANHLVKRARNGLEKVRKRADEKGEHHSKIQSIVSTSKENPKDDDGHKTLPSSGDSLDNLLQKLEAVFEERRSSEQSAAKAKAWHSWYYSACLRIVLHHRGHWHNDRRVKGVKLLHQIVNKIAAGHGPKALMVVLAYAGKLLVQCCPNSS